MRTSYSRALSVTLIASLLSGCMSMMMGGPNAARDLKNWAQGRSDLVIEDFERDGGMDNFPISDENWYRLGTVCQAYFELRNHALFDQCISAHMARDIPSKNQKYTNIHDIRGIHGVSRALLLIDEERHREAITVVEASLKHWEKGVGKPMAMAQHKMKLYAAAGIAWANLGDLDQAAHYAELVRTANVDKQVYYEQSAPRKHWRSAVHFAMQDYQKVIDIISEPDPQKQLEKRMAAIASFGLTLVVDPLVEKMLSDWSNFTLVPMNYMLTKSLLETGKIKEAKTAYDNALEDGTVENFAYLYPYLLYDRATIAASEQDFELAVDLLERAVTAIESQRSSLTSETSRIGFAGDKQAIYSRLVELLIEQQDHIAAFEYAERAKSRALVDMLAEKQTIRSNSLSEQDGRELLAEMDARASKANLVAIMNTFGSPTRQVAQNGAVSSNFEKISALADQEFASLVAVQQVDAAAIMAALTPAESLVEYFSAGDKLFVFVVDQNRLEGIALDYPDLELDIEEYRDSLTNPHSDNFQQTAQTLYEAIIGPIKGKLTKNLLTIVPHGELHYIPFAALHDGSQYLIEQHQLRVLPSASVLAFVSTSKQPKQGELLSLGNPDLGNPKMNLPGAELEASKLAQLTPNSKLLLRKQAKESALKRYGPAFNRIHFAMHGQFNTEDPLQSGLLMAADETDDGHLSVSELYDMELNTELVTLSACETGLGETANGDDVVGFTRGFLYAGAQSIVSSLWQVSDQATSELMLAFYQQLESNDKSTALQLAQSSVAKKYQHPYYWAAFQLAGNN